MVIVVAASMARSLSQHKQYTATSALLFRDPQLDQKFFGSSFFAQNNDAQREAATNVQLVSLSAISRLASAALENDGISLSPAEVTSSVAVEAAGQSDVVNILATRPSAAQAALVANVFAQTYITFRRDNDRAKVTQAVDLIGQQIRQEPADSQQNKELSKQMEQLGVLKALQTGNAELVQAARPPASPSSPRPKRAALIAIVLGGLLGFILVFLTERLDRRLRDIDEVQDLFGKPVLAAVSVNPLLAAVPGTRSAERRSSLEPFRMLRANLAYFNIGSGPKSLVVTSGSPGEGKTTVATNLAVVSAVAGQRVLLIESDLRRPRLAQQLGVPPSRGLSEVLSGQADVDDVTFPYSLPGASSDIDSAPVLDVLLAGSPPPNPAELVGSAVMSSLLDDLEAKYDLVVIDTPPVTVVADALLLLQRGSRVVVVVRLKSTSRDTALRVREQLATVNVNLLGVIVNAVPTRGSSGYYYGAYGFENPDVKDTEFAGDEQGTPVSGRAD